MDAFNQKALPEKFETAIVYVKHKHFIIIQKSILFLF